MTRRWPQDPQPFGDDHPSSFLGALYSPDMPNSETSHDDYRSLDDPTRAHRAGVVWTDPVHVPTVRLRWRAGWAPRRFRVVVRDAEGWTPICDWAQADLIEHREIDRSVTGVAVEQAPGGGPTKAPGVMRVAAMSLPGPSAALRVRRRGRWYTPQMPLAIDGSPWTVLDISDAEQVRLEGVWERISIDVVRCGDVGGPDALRRWARQPHVLAAEGAASVESARWLDLSKQDAVGGFARLIFVPVRPLKNPTLRIDGLHATGVVAIGRHEPTGAQHVPAPIQRLPAWTHADVHTLADAEAVTLPLRHAASLGRPGSDARVGLLPDGGIVLRRGAHADCVHLAVQLNGDRVPTDVGWSYAGPLARRCGPLCVRVDAEGIVLQVDVGAPTAVTLSACAREGLWPRPMTTPPFGSDWVAPRDVLGSHTSTRTAASFTVRLLADSGPDDAVSAMLLEGFSRILPTGFSARLNRLLEEASLFVEANHRVCYGLFPSVYADAVFGLEEDYLFRGLAFWGGGEIGLRAFRATYLNARHLDPRHYLHDLRMGLTPWQLWHLLRLTDTAPDALDAGEIALLRGVADWIITGRAKTADATGEMTEGGWRVFPGLLPPFRYGGDLDFPTQSLYVNAANWRGLEAVAAITGDDHSAELADYQQAIRAAFEAMYDGETQPLHSGGADPGEYLQLMTCGILDPLQFFAPDDPIGQRIDAQVADDAHLFSQLPRFNGWGVAPGIDAVYCHGYLINALRRGDRPTFWAGLCGLFAHAFDRALFTAREVGPIQLDHLDLGHWLPGRRLSRSEPCVGSVGVALMLLRHALVTEMDDDGLHLRCLAGLLPEWRGDAIEVRCLPTISGHVSIRLAPGAAPEIQAAGATLVEWVDADGAVHACS